MDRFYFDHNATTPVSPEVLEALVPALLEVHGNPSSIHHYGQMARQKLELARRDVASFLGAKPREIVFVSGGTEADNLAIFGAVRASKKARKHVITSTIEHPAVLNSLTALETEGVEVTRVPVDSSGAVDPDAVRRALRSETVLISLMHANNELGTIQPIAAVAGIAREAGVTMHVDGVQAAGKIPIDVRELGVDLYSISGHKIYAPKGIGALYVRGGTKMSPIQYGGRHEFGHRAGTENVTGAIALAAAVRWMREHQSEESERVAALRDRLEARITERVPGARVNGMTAARVPNTTNISFDGVAGEAMVISLDLKNFAVSSGAACSSGAVEPSHILIAIGLSADQARSSLRFSLGRSNTAEHVDALLDAVVESAAQLRKLSPVHV